MTSDNAFLFSGSDDKLIKIWDPNSGQCVGDLVGHTDCAYLLTMTSDDKLLISAGWDNQIIFWDWKNRSIDSRITGHTNQVFYVLLTPDEKRLISGGRDCTMRVWDMDTKEELASFNYGNSVFGIAVTANGNEIVAAGFSETIKIFNFEDKTEMATYTPGIGPLQALVLTPDNKYMIFGSRSGALKVWTYSTKKEYCSLIGNENSIRNLSVTSDSKFVISSSLDKTIRIFNITTKTEEIKLLGCGGWIYGQYLSRDGQYILAGSTDKILRMWKIGNRVRVKTITGHPQAIASVAITRDGRFIATACEDKIVRKWDAKEGKLLGECRGHSEALWAITISTDNSFIASAGADKNIILWDFQSCALDTTLTGHTNTIFSLAITSDSKILASASGDMMINLWDLATKTLSISLGGHTDTIFALCFTFDDKELISGAGDYTIRVWDMQNKGKSCKFEAHTGMIESISLNKDETILALGCRDKMVHLWNWKLKKPMKKFLGHTNVVKTVKFFADSNMLMSASLDFTVQIWNADEEIHDFNLQGHTLAVRCADLTSDGRYVVSASNDCTIKLWDLQSIGELELVDISGTLDSFLYLTKIKTKASPSLINYKALFSPLRVNLAHIYAYLGYEDLLAEALDLGTEIRTDSAGNSPLQYALLRRSQGCIDVILDFITDLKSNNFETFLNYTYALRDDFEILLDNRSESLPDFLNAIFYKVPNLTNFAVPKFTLPHLHFSEIKALKEIDFVFQNDEVQVNDKELPIEFKAMPFPIFFVKGSSGSIDLLDSISNCPNPRILRTEIVRVFIRYRWDMLRNYILALTLLVWTNLFLMTTLLVLKSTGEVTDIYYIAILVAFILVNAVLALYEIIQARAEGLVYFIEFWNIVDMLRLSFTTGWIILSHFESDGNLLRYVAWFMAILNIYRGLSGFRAFDATRYYTRLISRAFFDSIAFLLVFFYSTLGLGIIYLAANPTEAYSIWAMWTIPYELSMGSFNNGGFSFLEYVGFILASFVNVVIILNLLISILGDSFDSFQAVSIEIDCLDMVELIIELETMMKSFICKLVRN